MICVSYVIGKLIAMQRFGGNTAAERMLKRSQVRWIKIVAEEWNNAIWSNMVGPRDYHT